jgi:hypothetical protein
LDRWFTLPKTWTSRVTHDTKTSLSRYTTNSSRGVTADLLYTLKLNWWSVLTLIIRERKKKTISIIHFVVLFDLRIGILS